MKTTEFVQAIRKMAVGIDKVTCFGEGIIYRIWVRKNQFDSVKVAMIWQDKNRKIIEPEGYRAIKDYLSALEEFDLLGIISDYMATPIDERGLPDSGGRQMTHELKITSEYFSAVLMGTKTFEIRKNDRGYKVGDMLILKEWVPGTKKYTGKSVARKVTYITDYQQKPGYVVMAIG